MMPAMKLAEYIDMKRGNAADLAKALGVNRTLIYKWARGKRLVPTTRCLMIARATSGLVSCEEMRPDLPWGL